MKNEWIEKYKAETEYSATDISVVNFCFALD